MWNTHGIGEINSQGLLGYRCRVGEFWTNTWSFPDEPQHTFTGVRVYSLHCVRPNIIIAQQALAQAITLHKVSPSSAIPQFNTAFSIYRAAARQHWSWGMLGLAKMYDAGYPPVEKSLKSAEYWFVQAAWTGDKRALQELAVFYQSHKKVWKKAWAENFAQGCVSLIIRCASLIEIRQFLYEHVVIARCTPQELRPDSIQLVPVALEPKSPRSSQVA